MNHIDCSNLSELVSAIPLVQACDTIRDGILRLMTPFQYPNGESIDLFLKPTGPLFDEFVLTDLGQTTSYLLDMQVKPWATNKRRQIVEDVCRSLGVQAIGGEIQCGINLGETRDLATPMMNLAQACLRISDLAFSARLWSAGSFKDDLEEFLSSALGLPYETDVIELGIGGEPVKFDFRISGETSVSLVLALSAASTVPAHRLSNEALSRWFGLGRSRKSGQQRFTILDDSHDVFKEADLKKVATLSTILTFPAEQEDLRAALRAA